MFFFMPMVFNEIIWIYILAAIIPAIFLLRYIYKCDTVEKEPPQLLGSLILYGVAAALCSVILEWIGSFILNNTISRESPYYILVLAFLVVAAVEEGTKLYFLKRRTWNDWNFSHLFDGVVYSAFVSLGFAAFENIKYVFSYGLSVVLPRALFAIPGHLGFSVFMGVFYGRAKMCENYGDEAGKKRNLVLAYVSAVLLHGFYDACAMSGTKEANIIFYVFVAAMYVIVYRVIKKASAQDRPIY
ncbi:MAG: PrsW family intramembrane metalloprotease [Eubacteriales bacterium]|nr:PrsW family intramembrane metalloprotease [Eubacteriales bacterium]